MALESEDIEQIRTICKLETYEFFHTYLNDVFPKQMEAIINAHNTDDTAHEGKIASLMRTKWMLIGAAATAGAGGGAGLLKLLQSAGL